MRKLFPIFLLLVLAVFLKPPYSSGDSSKILLLPTKGSRATGTFRNNLYLSMKKHAGKQSNFIVPPGNPYFWYPLSGEYTVSDNILKQYRKISLKYGTGYLLTGKTTYYEGTYYVRAYLYSVEKNRVLYRTSSRSANGSTAPPALSIIRSVNDFRAGRIPAITRLSVSKNSIRNIVLEWETNIRWKRFIISRSYRRYGPFKKLAVTGSGSYTDRSAERGIKYWYRIAPVVRGGIGDQVTDYGYVDPGTPRSLQPGEILDIRNRERPPYPSDPEKLNDMKLHLLLMEHFYDSPFIISLIVFIGRPYVERGEMLVYRDYKNYRIDRKNQLLYMYKPGTMEVRLHSKRLFRFILYNDIMKIPERELVDRVLRNGIVFCIRNGVKEDLRGDGRVHLVPRFRALGFSTEYWRDYKKWKSHTIVFGSDEKDLAEEMGRAYREGR